MSFRICSFYSSLAFELSMFDRIELSVPVAKENEITPESTSKIQMIFSPNVPPEMSPNPTVVIVVTVKYNEDRKSSMSVESCSPYRTTQVSGLKSSSLALKIHRQATMWQIRKKNNRKKRSRSKPELILRISFKYLTNLFFCLSTLRMRTSLVILISLYNLGKRAILTSEL